MKYISQFGGFVIELFTWRFVPLYLFAIFATVFLVFSGLDWRYLVYVQTHGLAPILVTADITGFVVPVLLPAGLFLVATLLSKKKVWWIYFQATVYSILLSFTLSTIIKAFTGRVSPPHHHHGVDQALVDNSHQFNFGFMETHVSGGWPSSHASVAFALATMFILILPVRWYVPVLSFSMAFFIGIGVTFGFHWLSEFVAGTCLGVAVGVVVGRHFRSLLHK